MCVVSGAPKRIWAMKTGGIARRERSAAIMLVWEENRQLWSWRGKREWLTKIEDAMIACLFFGFLTCLAPAPAPPVGGRQTTVYSSCMIASGNKLNASVVTGSATSAGNRM